MEIEYSNEVRGKVFSYRFTEVEQQYIVDGLKPIVKKIENKIEKIRNHPKNEGQAKYGYQIDALRTEIESLEVIIKAFSE